MGQNSSLSLLQGKDGHWWDRQNLQVLDKIALQGNQLEHSVPEYCPEGIRIRLGGDTGIEQELL